MNDDDWEQAELPPTDLAARGSKIPLPETMRVVVMSGPDQGLELALQKGTYVVGKGAGAQLVLTDGEISRAHLELRVCEDGVVVRDLGSTNGSYFGGARFSEVTVGAGAVLELGHTTLKLLTSHRAPQILPSTAKAFGPLVGGSLAMRQVYGLLERVAPTDATVLVDGELGTGKELCAEALHAASRRADGPFVVFDVAGLARSLLDSELFGHVRGAFTGADRDREGTFQQASGGTLFLDEVGELELELQPRLLRALDTRRIKPVGGSKWIDVDVRVVCSSRRNLREEVAAGRFREDLFHRLSVVRVTLPPLRDRREDIPVLVQKFVSSHDVSVSPDAMALLAEYDWPGNVRELKNAVDRSLSLLGKERVLTPTLLGLEPQVTPSRGGVEGFRAAKEKLVSAWERDYVTKLLASCEGNVSKAARDGGIDRVYLHRLIKKYGLVE